MNKSSFFSYRGIAALLAALTAGVHFFVGGQDALAPMLSVALPAPSEGAMHAVWHIVSVFLAWSVVVFFKGGEVARQFAWLWVASAAVFIYAGLYQSGVTGLVVNPQWTILGLTGAIVLFDAHSASAQKT